MEHDIDRTAQLVQPIVDRELGLIRDAIALVAGGGSPRVMVAGLQLGESLLEPAMRLAQAAGVRIVPDWSADGHHVDFAVERVAG